MGRYLPWVDLGNGTVAKQLSAGGTHVCALLPGGRVKCWGRNDDGQLGLGDSANHGDERGEMGEALPAVQLGEGRSVVQVAAGAYSTCAVLDDASVKCWGRNYDGQLGQGHNVSLGGEVGGMGDALPAVHLGTGVRAVKVAVGLAHACALLEGGRVKCWGANGAGQLGLGDNVNRGVQPDQMGDALPEVRLGTDESGQSMAAQDIVAGSDMTCAVLVGGRLKCWGANRQGQLGLGNSHVSWGNITATSGDALPFVNLGANATVLRVFTSMLGSHTCALLSSMRFKCWGANDYAQLGVGSAHPGASMGTVPAALPTLNITAPPLQPEPPPPPAHMHSPPPSVLPSPSLGSFPFPLPPTNYQPPLQPMEQRPLSGLLAMGDVHTCAMDGVDDLRCWGDNTEGQLGAAGVTLRITLGHPVSLALDSAQLQVYAGSEHSCALATSGRVKCWGSNDEGQLGLGDVRSRGRGSADMGTDLPYVDLGPGSHVVQLALGRYHSCALLQGGIVKCWGSNGYGQLGLESTLNAGDGLYEMGDDLPEVNLGHGVEVVQLSACLVFTCAVLNTSQVKCWGENDFGQLGAGHNRSIGDDPGEMGDALAAVDLGTGARSVKVAAGYLHACALLNNGSIKCWGHNAYGELGLGDTRDRGLTPGDMGDALPVINLGLDSAGRPLRATDVTAGYKFTCALLVQQQVKCWGYGETGSLGQGSTSNWGDSPEHAVVDMPVVDLGSADSVRQVYMGLGKYACALLASGRVKCWGRNNYGQLGLGDVVNRGDRPQSMGDLLPALSVVPSVELPRSPPPPAPLPPTSPAPGGTPPPPPPVSGSQPLEPPSPTAPAVHPTPHSRSLSSIGTHIGAAAAGVVCTLLLIAAALGLRRLLINRKDRHTSAARDSGPAARSGVWPSPGASGTSDEQQHALVELVESGGMTMTSKAAPLQQASGACQAQLDTRRTELDSHGDQAMVAPSDEVSSVGAARPQASRDVELHDRAALLMSRPWLDLKAEEQRLLVEYCAKHGLDLAMMCRQARKEDLSQQLDFLMVRWEDVELKGRLSGPLGHWACGPVHLARWHRSAVAVKLVSPSSVTERTLAALQREAYIMSKLHHPNIAQLHGLVLDHPHYALVMQHCPRGSLAQHLQGSSSPLPLSRRLDLAMDVADGLSYLHTRPEDMVVHGRLTSANLMLDDGGRVVLSDFGLSALVASTTTLPSTDIGPATIAYCAPEILSAPGARRTLQSDVFALGSVLYEIVTMKKPFEGHGGEDVADHILQGRRPAIPPSTPTALDALIRQCWLQEPQGRPDAALVLAVLQRIASSPEVLAPAASEP